MKYLASILFCLSCAQSFAFPRDKQKHIAMSFAIESASYVAFRVNGDKPRDALWKSFFVTLGAGLLKEIWDDEFNWSDMGANMIGLSSAMVIPIVVEF